jgi:phosphoglycolate phosphatase-like HAD superfamily hydrolase
MSEPADPQAPLRDFRRAHDFFVGIDSDGCAFDTMEVKHKECFIPHIVGFYGLAAVSKYAREAAEFVNLYSKWRGVNRFPALTATFDLLADRPEVARRGVALQPLAGLRAWVARESRLANPTLKAEAEATGDPDLVRALRWSEAVNATIGQVVKDVPPFPFVRDSLEALAGRADVMVVSATPGEALKREWDEHGLTRYVALIAGQERGSKTEQLALATSGRYEKERVLMVGDAPGDLKAAQANGVLFYPINPGAEDESWRRFHDEALPRFYAGTYAGTFMSRCVAEFEALLPEVPPWKTTRP